MEKDEFINIQKSYGDAPKSEGHIAFLAGEEYFYAGEGIEKHVRKAWIPNEIEKTNKYGSIRKDSRFVCTFTAWQNGPLAGIEKEMI